MDILTYNNINIFSFPLTIDKIIGIGSYGIVFSVKDKPYAIKLQSETKEFEHLLTEEIKILKICTNIVKYKICLHFTILLKDFKVPNRELDIKTYQLWNNDNYNIYGSVMLKMENTVAYLTSDNKYFEEIFNQIVFALYILNKKTGYYHNDVTINNILISATDPFTEIYIDDFSNNIIINVDKYFAVLSDMGLTSKRPIIFDDKEVLNYTIKFGVEYYNGLNYVSDYNRLILEMTVSEDAKKLKNLLLPLWKEILEIIKISENLKKSKNLEKINREEGLSFDTERIKILYQNEQKIVETYLMNNKIVKNSVIVNCKDMEIGNVVDTDILICNIKNMVIYEESVLEP